MAPALVLGICTAVVFPSAYEKLVADSLQMIRENYI